MARIARVVALEFPYHSGEYAWPHFETEKGRQETKKQIKISMVSQDWNKIKEPTLNSKYSRCDPIAA
jgi:hypothetical protein